MADWPTGAAGGLRIRRHQGIGNDREYGRVHPPHVIPCAGWKAGQHLRDGRVDQQRAGHHVAAPAKIDGYLRRSARRLRPHVLHARHCPDRLLDRAGDQQSGLVGGPAACIKINDDARKGHLREKPNRQGERTDAPCHGQRQRQHDDRAGVPLDERNEAHPRLPWDCVVARLGPSRTAIPSLS